MIVIPFILIILLSILTIYLTSKNNCKRDCKNCMGCNLYKEDSK